MLALTLAGCAASVADVARRQLAEGRVGLAVETLSADPAADPELKAVAEARLQGELEREIAELESQGHSVRALERRLLLVGTNGAPAGGLGQAMRAAADELGRDLDRRLGRARAARADLNVCRRAQALAEGDGGLDLTCERLTRALVLFATVEAKPAPGAAELAGRVAGAIAERNPVFLRVVRADHAWRSAKISVEVDPARVVDSGWVTVARAQLHRWVPRTDDEGEPLTERVEVPPSAEAIAEAASRGEAPPAPTYEDRVLMEEVSAEVEERARRVDLSAEARVHLEDLRRPGHLEVALAVELSSGDERRYQTLRGDPRARGGPATLPERAEDVAPLPGPAELLARAVERAAAGIADEIVRGIE